MQEEVPIGHCYTQPHLYRLCNKVACISWKLKCPCKAVSGFRCMIGNCISIRFKCDGVKHCLYGEDEQFCQQEQETEQTVTTQVTVVKDNILKEQTTTNENLSTPVVVTIASVSVFVCILLAVLLYIFIVRRRKKSSKNSEPVSEPLRSSNRKTSTGDSESPSVAQDILSEIMYVPVTNERSNQLYVHNQIDHLHNKIDNSVNKSDNEKVEIDNDTYLNEDASYREKNNLAINPGTEIYITTQSADTYKQSGLGRYTFKP